MEKIEAVQKVLRFSHSTREWCEGDRAVYFDDFDEQNVNDYSPGGYGDIADEIIERGISEDLLEEDEIAAVVAELLGEDEEALEEEKAIEETIEEVKLEEDSGEEEGRHYKDDQEADEKHLKAIEKDIDYDKRHHEAMQIAGKTNELLETIKALQEQNDNFKADNSKMVSGMNEQNEAIQKLTTTLEELSLQNAKLLYTNEVLKADSLNERQKQIAVEALQAVESVEHAKTVFDTLQSTVVSTKRQGRPESLSEVVSNNTSIKMPRRKEKKNVNPHENRWKLLAGIK